ncbi:MAG: type II toxin-antitoxin system PemK/MazF family toxin [Pseudonocardiaceae bacterium]
MTAGLFRGDVWDVLFPQPVGARPCVVLTTNALITRLGAVTVAEITSTQGPSSTHIEVPPEAGLIGRPRSWVNVTGLHTVPKGKLRRRRGRLDPTELAHVATAVRDYLDLDD